MLTVPPNFLYIDDISYRNRNGYIGLIIKMNPSLSTDVMILVVISGMPGCFSAIGVPGEDPVPQQHPTMTPARGRPLARSAGLRAPHMGSSGVRDFLLKRCLYTSGRSGFAGFS